MIRLVSPTGIRKNSTIARASASTTVPAHSALGISCCSSPSPSSGGSCALAETSSARKPIASEPPSATTPRMIGRRSNAVAAHRRVERVGRDRDLAERRLLGRALSGRELLGGRLAHGDRPVGDAAHHHALEHRLAAERRVADGGQLAVDQFGAGRRLRREPRGAEASPRRRLRAARSATPRPDAPPSAYLGDRVCARRPLATRRWKRSTRPPVSISFCRPV